MWLASGAGALQQAIRGGGTDRQQVRAHGVGEREMAMALQQGYKSGQKRQQAPRTDTVGGGPGDFERGLHRRTIPWGSRSANLGGRSGMTPRPASLRPIWWPIVAIAQMARSSPPWS